jgi:iron complex outermembrane receptor protein
MASKKWMSILMTGAAALVAGHANAQSAPSGAAVSPAQPDAAGIADIVVTATRRSESLQQVPVAVTAITTDQLSRSSISSTLTLKNIVPSFYVENSGVFRPVIRGIGTTSTALGEESNVALYVDGIYQPFQASNAIEFPRIDRVEVLRGPQGTLFGRNASGGLINIITPNPSFTPAGEVRVGLSAADGAKTALGEDFQAYLNSPISPRLAANLSVQAGHEGSYFKDVARNVSVGASNNVVARGKLMYESEDKDTKAILTLGYRHFSDPKLAMYRPFGRETIARSTPGGIVPSGDYDMSLSWSPYDRVNKYSASFLLEHDFDGINVSATSDYQRDRVEIRQDTDATNLNLSQFTLVYREHVFQQELKANSTSNGPFQWIAGAYGMWYGANSDIGLYSTSLTTRSTTLAPQVTTSTLAGFGEATYKLTDKLKVLAGLRYTTEKRSFTQFVNGNNLFGQTLHADYHKLTYRGSIEYSFAPRVHSYLTYSTGFKSGVFNANSTQAAPVQPELGRMLELGLKADPASWLRVNIAIFRQTYKNLQLPSRLPGSAVLFLLNAATAKIKGIELEATAYPTRGLRIDVQGSLLDPKYSSFPNAQVYIPVGTGAYSPLVADVSGNTMVQAPKRTIRVAADYEFKVGGESSLDLGAAFRRSSRVYFDYLNSFSQAPYNDISAWATLRLAGDRWRLSVLGSNLANTFVVTRASPGTTGVSTTPERPRTIKVQVGYKW